MMLRTPLTVRVLLVLPLFLVACGGGSGGDGSSSSSSSSFSSSVQSSSVSSMSEISVTDPMPSAVVTSPLIIHGEARGTWYFEASFPVKLLDSSGSVLASAPAQAQSDWMTENFVPFEATLTFVTASATGMLVLENDNPSGDPARSKSITVPVRFQE